MFGQVDFKAKIISESTGLDMSNWSGTGTCEYDDENSFEYSCKCSCKHSREDFLVKDRIATHLEFN